ncbi:unnamed protein product, partial [Didymodactylos carnosus]
MNGRMNRLPVLNSKLNSIKKQYTLHRSPSINERQVGNYPFLTPQQTIIQTTSGVPQEYESIYYEEDYDQPLHCIRESYVLQSDPLSSYVQSSADTQVIHHQQPSITYLSQPSSQQYLCSPSSQAVQTVIVAQQPQTTSIQPTFINQMPIQTTRQQPLLCVQSPLQQTASVILQQPQQIQQPQIIQTSMSVPQIIQAIQPQQLVQAIQPQQLVQAIQPQQLIQAIQPQQLIQAIQPQQLIQAIQPQQLMQAATVLPANLLQSLQASPQLLYQRPYDPVIIPMQNQQIAISPLVPLSQPSYAPARLVALPQSSLLAQQQQRPNMFQQALVRTVADQTGPIFGQQNPTGGLGLLSRPVVAAPLMATSTGINAIRMPMVMGVNSNQIQRPVPMMGMTQQQNFPIVPINGLLIPFQPSNVQQPRFPGIAPNLYSPISRNPYSPLARNLYSPNNYPQPYRSSL